MGASGEGTQTISTKESHKPSLASLNSSIAAGILDAVDKESHKPSTECLELTRLGVCGTSQTMCHTDGRKHAQWLLSLDHPIWYCIIFSFRSAMRLWGSGGPSPLSAPAPPPSRSALESDHGASELASESAMRPRVGSRGIRVGIRVSHAP